MTIIKLIRTFGSCKKIRKRWTNKDSHCNTEPLELKPSEPKLFPSFCNAAGESRRMQWSISRVFNEIKHRTNNKELQGQRNKTMGRNRLETTIHVQQLTKWNTRAINTQGQTSLTS